ncbi:hypothetical protein GGQ61_003630 [Phenylobacterium haematophilum]|uniref:Uncharacterized protein n=1 Tax=Phenylobacterium haematophilum TaxID=98513 RepID=A0A840A6A3_9CAUL|nr:hypothetical protein [Phenylobacterium haematophilum]MBB3892892.1 hypothetical protein [Phenylobacterium haematophilum]
MENATPEDAPALIAARPLSERELARLTVVTRRLPSGWLLTVRRRRLMFLGLAAPGFLAVFTTTLHHNFFVLVAGFVLFGAAVLFRAVSEPLFVRAEAADIWPPESFPPSRQREFPHA